jgi:hypothetical protein
MQGNIDVEELLPLKDAIKGEGVFSLCSSLSLNKSGNKHPESSNYQELVRMATEQHCSAQTQHSRRYNDVDYMLLVHTECADCALITSSTGAAVARQPARKYRICFRSHSWRQCVRLAGSCLAGVLLVPYDRLASQPP